MDGALVSLETVATDIAALREKAVSDEQKQPSQSSFWEVHGEPACL